MALVIYIKKAARSFSWAPALTRERPIHNLHYYSLVYLSTLRTTTWGYETIGGSFGGRVQLNPVKD